MVIPSIGDRFSSLSTFSTSSSSDSESEPETWFETYEVEIGIPVKPWNIIRPSAKPVKVIFRGKMDDTFELDEKALINILERPDVIDRKIVIISVAGAFRTGKSFLLNFFLRYLKYEGEKVYWLKDETIPLTGFSWRGGSERETDGIWLWNEPFFATLDSGEEVAILLMDTQGIFDSQSTVKECAAVFALSTLIASVQIYNLSQNVQEDHLQSLQMFTDYGKLALENRLDSTPFQTLIFLVRDWQYISDHPYGFEGGLKLLQRKLKRQENQHEELRQVRQYIQHSFSCLSCFLMPHPGLKIIEKRRNEFRGQLSKIDPKFKDHMADFVQTVLSGEHLCPKMVDGKEITGRELIEYFRSYVKVFQGDDLPSPKSVFLATAEASHLTAFTRAKGQYVRNMQDLFKPEMASMADEKLLYFHKLHEGGALKMFREIKKMGTANHEFTRKYLDRLKSEIEGEFEKFKVKNGIKRQKESYLYRAGNYIYEHREGIMTGVTIVGGLLLGFLFKR